MNACRRYVATFALAAVAACSNSATGPGPIGSALPINDLGVQDYLGAFDGGLYPGGTNTMPAGHATIGAGRAGNIQPLDPNGNPSPGGKYVLLSIGMSHVAQEWCSKQGTSCSSWSFIGKAGADPAVNHSTLVIANGAAGGKTASFWDQPSDPDYDRVKNSVLAPAGLTEEQVQVVWLKNAFPRPGISLPSAQADAYQLESSLASTVRALKVRYPNLQIVFVSSRSYAGYANTGLNPEPFAYESGFAVKWLIQAQIDQMNNGGTVVDARAGNLNYNTVAPWIAWGPYLWANADQVRSDGLVWVPSDFEGDGTHPSTAGEAKVANLLLGFFKSDTHASCWFLSGATCP